MLEVEWRVRRRTDIDRVVRRLEGPHILVLRENDGYRVRLHVTEAAYRDTSAAGLIPQLRESPGSDGIEYASSGDIVLVADRRGRLKVPPRGGPDNRYRRRLEELLALDNRR